MSEKKNGLREYIAGKTIAIIGAGISNAPLVQKFMEYGCKSVCVRDKKELSPQTRQGFEKLGAQVECGDGYLDGISADLVIRTPGLRPDATQLEDLRKKGTRVVGETQLFLQFAPCTVFGVTGSDGKTTTTTLISKLLETTGKRVYLGGNIGTPLLPLIDEMTQDDFACLELSSFQLMDGEYSPSVSVITNISENHLDWHKGMEEYKRAKCNIFSHQGVGDKLVLNHDDPTCDEFAALAKGKVAKFSLRAPVENGTYLKEDRLTICKDGVETPLFCKDSIRIPGLYNVANYLAAITATEGFISPKAAEEVAKSFNGVEHRVEWIRDLDGVSYYNSSIDSSPARTIATLGAFSQKLTVICGGYDKNLNYEVLKEPFAQRVKRVYVTGQTAPKILKALDIPLAPYTLRECFDIKEALLLARKEAKAGDVVILSPASASFDSFKNFEERGRYFKELVSSL